MKIAAFNVENMFSRPVALNQAIWAAGKEVLEAHSRANKTLAKLTYTTADRTLLVADLTTLGLAKSDSGQWPCFARYAASSLSEAPPGYRLSRVDEATGLDGSNSLPRQLMNWPLAILRQ